VGGIHHVTNGGHASRAEWAREVLRLAGVTVPTRDVPLERVAPPLDASALGRPGAHATPRRPAADWQAALAEYATIGPRTKEAATLSPEEAGSRLAGVRYGRLNRIGDRRGSFAELWRAVGLRRDRARGRRHCRTRASSRPIFRTSARGVLRGLHYHRRQLDYWTVVGGRALVAPRRRAARRGRPRRARHRRDARAEAKAKPSRSPRASLMVSWPWSRCRCST